MNASTKQVSTTPLGDIRAEFDHVMLERAFIETPDYRTLLESGEGKVVVGRRGTGKSALTYRLAQEWGREKANIVITIAAEEDQIIGVRPFLQVFGEKFQHIALLLG
jgi:MoxR-like ATPase